MDKNRKLKLNYTENDNCSPTLASSYVYYFEFKLT